MISIKTPREIELLRVAGEITGSTHNYLKQFIKPGITTKELDKLAEDYIVKREATPSFKGYDGFPGSICTSINNEVVHGIPSNRKLKNGDIISIDIGACYKGYHGDSAWTYPVGTIDKDKEYLLEHTEKALYAGLDVIKAGIRVGDIGYAVSKYANAHKLGVVKELVGHGVGNHLHEEPDVPNYGTKGTGPKIRDGMVIAIEPMLTLGSPDIYVEDNDWTVKTEDSSLSAHFEHTIAITNEGVIILTGE